MGRFTDKNVVITGGTSGIGLATAQRVVEEGGTALVTGRKPEGIDAANAMDGITAIANDAASPADAAALRGAVDEHLDGRVDALFLNAGLGSFAPITAVEADAFDHQFAVNVRGPLLQLKELVPTIPQGGSVLINTSVANEVGLPFSSVYAGTKGAVRSSMKALANELGPQQVRVNTIAPGPIETEFGSNAGISDEQMQGFVEQILPMVTLGRFGSSDEVAAAAAFLLSEEASYVTGTEMVVDGGMSN